MHSISEHCKPTPWDSHINTLSFCRAICKILFISKHWYKQSWLYLDALPPLFFPPFFSALSHCIWQIGGGNESTKAVTIITF